MSDGNKCVPTSELIENGVLVIGDGYRAKRAELSDDGLPFARAGNIDAGFHFEGAELLGWKGVAKAKYKVSKPGDVVFTSKGTVGRFAYVKAETPRFAYSPQLCFWRSLNREVLDSRYLLFWMHGPEFMTQVNAVKGQTDMADYVSLRDQRAMYITLPPLPIQHRIADILGALDDKIELNRRMNRTLEAMAQALYKHWFVDFGPFQDGEFVDSELGAIPKGWKREPLKKHVSIAKGLSYKGSGLAEEGHGLPMHNLNSVLEGGGYKYAGIKYYKGDYKARHIVRPGDIIVANTEQGFEYLLIGSPALVPRYYGEEGLFTHHLFRVRPHAQSPLTSNFMYLQLRYPGYRRWVTRFTNGTTVNMLFPEALKEPTTIVPPESVVDRFEAIIDPLLKRIEPLYEESVILAQTRDYLLPKLLSGKIAVEAAGEQVEDVL